MGVVQDPLFQPDLCQNDTKSPMMQEEYTYSLVRLRCVKMGLRRQGKSE